MAAKDDLFSHCNELASKQKTQIAVPRCSLQWRIDQFAVLYKLFENEDNLISKQFGSTQTPSVKWELLLYPNKLLPNKGRYSVVALRLLSKTSIRTRIQICTVDAKSVEVNKSEIIDTVHYDKECVVLEISHNDVVKTLKEDGSLQLICKIEHLLPASKASAVQTRGADRLDDINEKIQLIDSFKNMLTNELFADCVIKVDDKVLKAHRCILGQNSEVFRSMFASEGMVESQTRIVEIKDSTFEAVQAMVDYMYTRSTDMLESYAKEMLFLADKYAIYSLKKLCEQYISSTINCKNVICNAILADTHSASILKQACAKYISLHHRDVLCSTEWDVLKTKRAELVCDILESILVGDNAPDPEDLSTEGSE